MDKKKIIGYGCIFVNQTVRGGKIAYIEDIICDNSYRKKGIGKSIMKQLFNFAKDNKCYKIVLNNAIKIKLVFIKSVVMSCTTIICK